ncbi:hypothetical protein [Symbiopectobacterium purcellii]|uniref:Uncharacterized protein n=1 Tax=Symbiopectobacterium purcellii TaxID=2871826 RepID=A0ABX9ANI8_9ENTR|nr:hypothetical protein [Symbiopectobacterium purcellii]QZN94550.1 hypothetical protein K6K13_14755 [Symbiopectobacterium purcellii]
MPITSDFEYQCHDNFLHDDTLNHTRKKDNVALLNEITTINNEQDFNECNTHIFSKEHNNEASRSTSHSGRYNNDTEAGKVSRHRMFRRMLGLIASVTSIVSLWKIGGSGYHKNNQLCLSIDKSLDLLNEFPIDNLENARNTLPLKLYKNDGSFNNILCDGMNLSQHEYLKEIVVIDNLSLQNINELYQSVLFIDHKRNVRSIPLPYEHHVNASEIISNIINNNDIDWRIREEFKGVYHKAKDFIDIKNINEGIEKDVKLILACVSLMLQYLHENKINNLSKFSFIYGVAFTESLLSILDEMKASDLGIIDKRYKQSVMLMIRDIYANKENESYNNSMYFHENIIDAKALGKMIFIFTLH